MIEFDPDKERASRHGLPFSLAAEIFAREYVETVDSRLDYGETRLIAVGMVASLGLPCSAVYTWRGSNRGSSVSGGPVTATGESTVTVTPELLEQAHREVTPELLAWLRALTDEDIAAMVAADPDAAPALDDPVFDDAVIVRPLKDAAE